MRKALTGVSLAVVVALGAVACSAAPAASGGAGALDPGGGASPAGAGASPAAAATQSADGPRSFSFPPGVRVRFETPLPASGPRRAAMIGYENYVDSLWAAVATRGTDTAYEKYMGGNALTFARSLISEFTTGGYTLSGTIVYFSVSVPRVFYGAGAVVQSCVDASGLYMVNAATGKTAGPVFDSSYQHYQERAAAGKSANGSWTISHTQNFPASGGGSAGECE